MRDIVEALARSVEPSVAYKARVDLLGEDPASPDLIRLRDAIRDSPRVRGLLSERVADGTIPHHPYSKWYGAHWVLVALADLDYPPGDPDLLPLREQVLDWLLGSDHREDERRLTKGGLIRMHASMEGNAIYALVKLDLADTRVDQLIEGLLAWGWPDGGWNCDRKPQAHVSSFNETLIPLRGLAAYGRVTGDSGVARAVERAAGVFLQRHLFRRVSDGSVIAREFVRLHYPCYWHYDILIGLKVLDEAGFLGDERCQEALDLLESRRLSDGGFPADGTYYHRAESPENGRSLVDWGGTSVKSMNPFVTVEALAVLKRAGRGQF